MIHLRSISIKQPPDSWKERFPFNIPVISTLQELPFLTPVTLLVGENGSGKSTLLEAIACAAGSVTIGSKSVGIDQTLDSVRELADHLQLTWNKRTHKGFFLRAEDFFGYAKRIAKMREELEDEHQTLEDNYRDRSRLANELAQMPYRNELQQLDRRYGGGLDKQSHGESFLLLFQTRFIPGGLYLLDEPEAPLSPISQLAFMAMVKEMLLRNAQFILATHSPMIMAYPGATILNFDKTPIATVKYKELEHVNLLKDFLNNPESFLQHL
jgi:predicted ATPase